MYWYVVPYCAVKSAGGDWLDYVPAQGITDLNAFQLDNFVSHAHNPKLNPTSALIGLPASIMPLPAGWVEKSLEEARAYFESVAGRAPSSREVF